MAKAVDTDVSQMQRFAQRCKKASPEVHKQLRSRVRQAANVVRDDARTRAPSARIAKTIRSSASGSTATVKAGNPKVPEAALLEGDGTPGSFRHPLFGNKKKWYPQARQPYLHPALEANRETIERMLGDAAHDAAIGIVNGYFGVDG